MKKIKNQVKELTIEQVIDQSKIVEELIKKKEVIMTNLNKQIPTLYTNTSAMSYLYEFFAEFNIIMSECIYLYVLNASLYESTNDKRYMYRVGKTLKKVKRILTSYEEGRKYCHSVDINSILLAGIGELMKIFGDAIHLMGDHEDLINKAMTNKKRDVESVNLYHELLKDAV